MVFLFAYNEQPKKMGWGGLEPAWPGPSSAPANMLKVFPSSTDTPVFLFTMIFVRVLHYELKRNMEQKLGCIEYPD